MDLRLLLPYRTGNKDPGAPAISDDRALLTQLMEGGRHYQAAQEGRVFTGNAAAAGQVLPIFSGTAQKFGLWNPAGSGVDVELIRLALTYVDTTGAAGGYVLALVANAPANLGTGAAITAFTEGALGTDIFNARVGSGAAPKAKFTPSAATVTAPIILRHLGLNQLVTTAADATTVPWRAVEEFDGDLILPPGNAVFVAGNIATLSKWACSLTWKEKKAA